MGRGQWFRRDHPRGAAMNSSVCATSRGTHLAAFGAYLRDEWLQCCGVALAALGATLLALAGPEIGRYGWLAFLASNVALIAMAWRKRLWGLLALQIYFAFTSAAGVINHVLH